MRVAGRPARALLAILLVGGLAACGGSAVPEPMVGVTIVLTADPAIDGFVDMAGLVSANGQGIRVGDQGGSIPSSPVRGFVSFDLSPIPPGATILSAVLRVEQAVVVGFPYFTMGSLVVDHVEYGDVFPTSANYLPGILGNVATISGDATQEYKEAHVGFSVSEDLAEPRTRSQFRLRFLVADQDGDSANDFVVFTDAENTSGTGNVPQLVVRYLP
jgi:hypothetical protein